MTKEIIYVSAPFCPKCVRINRWLKELKKTNPEINIIKLNIALKMKEVKPLKIKTIPTLIIGEERLDGWIKEEEFQAAIEKL